MGVLSAKYREPLCAAPSPQVAADRKGQRYAFNRPTGMRSSVVALTGAGQRASRADGIPPMAVASLRAGGCLRAVVHTDTRDGGQSRSPARRRSHATAGRHRGRRKPAAPARLRAARQPDRQDLRTRRLRPGDDLRQRGRRRGRGGRPPPRHRHPLEQGDPGPVQPRRGWADPARLPAGRPHPGARPAHPAHLTDRRLGMSRLARRLRWQFTGWIAALAPPVGTGSWSATGPAPLRGGDQRDGRRPDRPPHPVRPHTGAGRVPHRRLPLPRRPGCCTARKYAGR
jgi:hypothetical protein